VNANSSHAPAPSPLSADRSFRKPRVRHPPRYWWRRVARNWPFVLWLGILLAVWQFYARTERYGEMLGAVETIAEPVAPLETARLTAIHVQPGQRVRAGDAVAQMDTTLIDAEIAIHEAMLAEAEQTITTYQRDMLQLLARSEQAIRDAEAALLAEQARYETEKAELAALQAEQARREALAARKLINDQTLNELRPQIAALERSVAALPELLVSHRQRLADARRQAEDTKKWIRMREGQDVSEAIAATMEARNASIEATRKMLLRRKEHFTLRATRDGVVSTILEQPGNVINAGQPILTLIAEHPQHVIGFLPEVHVTDLTVGERAYVWRGNRVGRRVAAVVVSVSPDVQALPGRVSPIQGQALRGRRVLLKLEGPHDFIPGETVEIHEAGAGFSGLLERLRAWRRKTG